DIDDGVRDILTRHLRFTSAELSDLQRGRIVRHGLDGNAPGEVAVVGAVKIATDRSTFFDRVRDITHFKSGPDILQIGRFSNPPSMADLASLTVTANDFNARMCRIGDCDLRLPADEIRRVPQEIDLRAPDVQKRTEAWFKQVLLDDVTAYLSGSGD